MPIRDNRDVASATPQHTNAAAKKKAARPARQGDEKRGSAESRLDAFANKVRPTPPKKPKVDRRRKRQTTADIDVPHQQINMNALRFGLRGLDILMVCAIIAVGIWNGYVGINNRGIAAPIAAAVLGSVIFIAALFVSNAYRFNAASTLSSHLKTQMHSRRLVWAPLHLSPYFTASIT